MFEGTSVQLTKIGKRKQKEKYFIVGWLDFEIIFLRAMKPAQEIFLEN